MPLDATGRDAQGNWIKETADGIFTWNPEMNVWLRLLTAEPIFVIDYAEGDILPISVYVSEAVEGGDKIKAIFHENNKENPLKNDSLMSVVMPQIWKRYYGGNPSRITVPFKLALLNGELPTDPPNAKPITIVAVGKEQEWTPNNGIDVFIKGWDEMMPKEGNSIVEWKDPLDKEGWSIRSRIGIKGGVIMSEVAFEGPLSSKTDKQIRMAVILHLARILDTKEGPWDGFSTIVDLFADDAGDGTTPYIQVDRTP
jgi:hypothetical protein